MLLKSDHFRKRDSAPDIYSASMLQASRDRIADTADDIDSNEAKCY